MYKVKSKKLYEQVVEQIKNMILCGTYVKGQLLPSEKELMEMMGVSRITIREAIRLLAEVGIVETHKGKGSIILIEAKELRLNSEEEKHFETYRQNFRATTEMRILLEPEIAKHVAQIATEDDIEDLRKRLSNEYRSENNRIEGDKLQSFHYKLMEILNNPLASKLFDEITELEANYDYQLLIPPASQETIGNILKKQHENVFKAIQAHNGEFAYFYMKEHMLFLQEVYEEYFRNFF